MKTMRDRFTAMAKTLGLAEVEKRKSLFVSRPVLNNQEWYDWAVKHGIPKPLAAADLHVTILASAQPVQMKPQADVVVINTMAGWSDPGCFMGMGPDEASLAFVFDCWPLSSRHWQFIGNGAISAYPTYRPHMSLSYDAKGFELSDEALAEAPDYIVLGGEVYDDLKTSVSADDADPEGVDDDSGIVLIEIDVIVAKAAKEFMETDVGKALGSPADRTALSDIAAGHPVSLGVAKRLGAETWAPDFIRKLPEIMAKVLSTDTKKMAEREVVIQVTALPSDIFKNLQTVDISAFDEEHRIVKGIASVSTVGGVLLKDLEGDEVTTQALWEFNRSLLSGARAGKFSHEGDVRTEIVGGLVLSDDWQKALGIDGVLGFEPYLVDIHVPGDEDWADAKKGNWMLSIAGTMLYEVGS